MFSRRTKSGVTRSADLTDGRGGWSIHGEWGHVSVLAGGGHICELGLNSVPELNPLWKPHWRTIDPHQYSASKHKRAYGPAPDGRLLAGIAGHSLSFDHFGPPSEEEVRAGLTTHGEAPSARWRLLKVHNAPWPAMSCGCELREAHIDFVRTIAIDPENPVIYCTGRATNLSSHDRPVSWNEHVTFGPPFLECNRTRFDMPATRARVCPADYSEENLLVPDAEFSWPAAPAKEGGTLDLRTMPERCYGQYTAQLLDPSLKIAFISVCNAKRGLLVVYAFRRTDFPWVGNWEERYNRRSVPWNGKAFCRGVEFSSTPFAIPKRQTIEQGPLFDERTYRWLPGKSGLEVRFLILLFAVPETFGGVSQLTIKNGRARLLEAGPSQRELSAVVKDFLESEPQRSQGRRGAG